MAANNLLDRLNQIRDIAAHVQAEICRNGAANSPFLAASLEESLRSLQVALRVVRAHTVDEAPKPETQ